MKEAAGTTYADGMQSCDSRGMHLGGSSTGKYSVANGRSRGWRVARCSRDPSHRTCQARIRWCVHDRLSVYLAGDLASVTDEEPAETKASWMVTGNASEVWERIRGLGTHLRGSCWESDRTPRHVQDQHTGKQVSKVRCQSQPCRTREDPGRDEEKQGLNGRVTASGVLAREKTTLLQHLSDRRPDPGRANLAGVSTLYSALAALCGSLFV